MPSKKALVSCVIEGSRQQPSGDLPSATPV